MSKTIGDWQRDVTDVANDHGWQLKDHAPRSVAAELCLIHSEVSEALEEVRTRGAPYDAVLIVDGKPEGFAVELADVVIRCLCVAGQLGIDLEDVVAIKHAFNAQRPYRHGGKAL
jgi:NTP pyrophosphatase (non-canonical NTP hydrolase)